jgi:CBS domain-containing protein
LGAALGWGALAASSLVFGALLGRTRTWPSRQVGIVLAFGAGALISAVRWIPMPSIAAMPASTQERLTTPVRDIMRPGVITIAEDASLLQAKRAMVRHGVHAVLVVGSTNGQPLGWVSVSGLLAWLERDLDALPAAQGITEPSCFIEPGASARDALEALEKPGVTHLLVRPTSNGATQGVVAAMDIVDLVTHP